MTQSDSDDELPLALLKNKDDDDELPLARLKNKNKVSCSPIGQIQIVIQNQSDTDDDEMSVDLCDYDSDRDPEFHPGTCEVRRCKEEVWAACPDCEILLCHDHFLEDVTSCAQHGKPYRAAGSEKNPQYGGIEVNVNKFQARELVNEEMHGRMERSVPEQYTVEGSEKEVRRKNELRSNKQKEAKRKRNSGQEYTSVKTKKIVPAKHIKARCNGACEKQNKQCATISDEQRQAIFNAYHSLGDLILQREFLVRHIKCCKPKRKYTEGESRRNNTRQYTFTVGEILVPVCKVFFLNTLSISEQSTRTALNKVTSTGTIEMDKRGGRQSETERERDSFVRKDISDHIDRFPKVESHYCREKSTREYLSPDLSKRHMYHMFLQEWMPKARPPSFTTYCDVFSSKNLSIHRPKKDQCSLCVNFHQGNEEVKRGLMETYERHVGEKNIVRDIKDKCKKAASENEHILCASFDLQQVIYLPMSQESAIFYKRRLSNYNLTFYNISNKDCHCFVWDETHSKRGSSEISTSVHRALKFYDDQGIKKAFLFSDGCSGQNKNSITPAMMLYTLSNSVNLEEISLRFFETNHGQNEGDSAHSAIGHALKRAGDLFLPSQVTTVMSLARSQKPYLVNRMLSNDFLDFKGLSKELRIMDARRGSDTEDNFTWNSIMELRVIKEQTDKVFYKTSHFDSSYKTLSLKRLKKSVKDLTLQKLNTGRTNVSKEKYADLVSLCSGPTPVIKQDEHKTFYLSLPHDD